ncbi:MAG TPA: M56 family metallopeptidase [Bdellovibrionota bacterium]|nr:M56 family metallopeptidase [Bdellovibrionota bacterium]
MLTLLITNIFHSFAGLVWIHGLKRVLKPFSPALDSFTLELVLLLPPVIALLRAFGAPTLPEHFSLIRIVDWTGALNEAGPLAIGFVIAFLSGTFLIFIVQEFFPVWTLLTERADFVSRPNPDLESSFEQIKSAFIRAGMHRRTAHPVKVLCPAVKYPFAALHGLLDPVLLVSEGLVRKLDRDELTSVIAHELAHLFYGANLRMLFTWALRALQSYNPVSLIAFRALSEAREASCDDLAVLLTKNPHSLRSALLKLSEPQRDAHPTDANSVSLQEAYDELLHRAEFQSTHRRLEALAPNKQNIGIGPVSGPMKAALTMMMGGLMWTIA